MSDHLLLVGDCRVELRKIPDASVHACVTDPPYEVGMDRKEVVGGAAWDRTGVAFDVAVWREVRRILRPGGQVVAFGAARTYHRLALALEEAGFEVIDSLHWQYTNGHALQTERLRPAHEPAVLARKAKSERTWEENVARWGCGLLRAEKRGDEQKWTNAPLGTADAFEYCETPAWPVFWCPKPSDAEKEAGCEGLPLRECRVMKVVGRGEKLRHNYHPTVKPIKLMRWLVELVSPPGGVVLDPFAGSGTTCVACELEGRDCVAVELDPGHAEIIRARVAWWKENSL